MDRISDFGSEGWEFESLRVHDMYYVYFLYLSNGDIYKGSSGEVLRRYSEHEAGNVESTRNYRPLKLIGYESYILKSDALRREKFLKTTEGRRLLNQQYRDIINQMKEQNSSSNLPENLIGPSSAE